MRTTRTIVLARGLGTRMRAADPSARLSAEQQRAADAGLKAMIPLNGRPFLDYILSALADAGIRDAGLIVAPEHRALRHY
jgi:dTDP-glucose pyrophosphorylase